LNKNRLAIVGVVVVAAAVALFATCGGCGKSNPKVATPQASESASPKVAEAGAPVRSERLWELAKDGEEEDLATLAVHEGAAGLVEGAANADLRLTALRAMGHARGWAQLPYLADAATGKDDGEARAALESIVDLAARPRTSEDPEDAAELSDGCEKLVALAKATDRERWRRVQALRALRMTPCPKTDLPTDLDAR
jgi:hypothetical protein